MDKKDYTITFNKGIYDKFDDYSYIYKISDYSLITRSITILVVHPRFGSFLADTPEKKVLVISKFFNFNIEFMDAETAVLLTNPYIKHIIS